MWSQIAALIAAQFRITRNHLPRTGVGSILLGFLGLLWYGSFVAIAVLLAVIVQSPEVTLDRLNEAIPVALICIFAFWQLVPLFTLSGGWSLQLSRLLAYPIKHRTLFAIEVLLRITTAPEMIIVLTIGMIGLFLRADVRFHAFALLLYIPFNLLLSLAIREWVLQAFARNKFREIFAILIVSIGVIPQLLARTSLGHRLLPYVLSAAHSPWTPWGEVGLLTAGASYWPAAFALIAGWTYLCYTFARRQFEKGLYRDETVRVAASPDELAPGRIRKESVFAGLANLPNRLFKDPLAALLQKEYRSLLRMPRFRVMFGMACVFSVLVFIPMTLSEARHGRDTFFSNNFLVITTLYGLLILSDSLLLNVFGFDRLGTQIYFVTPIPFRTVLIAKNLTAISFVLIQSVCVAVIAAVVRIALTPINILNAVLAAAVVGIFFLSVGNMTSISMARPINPLETFRKQAGGKMQLWMLLCAIGMCSLVGFAFLARWALDKSWAMGGVLGIELVIGYIVYRVAMDSAVDKALERREHLIDALSKGAGSSVMGLGIS